MKLISCLDVVLMLAEEKGEELQGTFVRDELRWQQLVKWCETLDRIGEILESIGFCAEVRDDLAVEVTLECPFFTVNSELPEYGWLAEQTESIRFEPVDDEYLAARLTFTGAWIKL